MKSTTKDADAFRHVAQQLENWRATLTEAQIVQTNLDCMHFHCDAFHIDSADPVLRAFEEIVQAAGEGVVESSVKVTQGIQHAARFNILCSPANKTAFLEQMFCFARAVARTEGITLDADPLHHMLTAADLSRVTRMVCGVDLREKRAESRLKIWVFAHHRAGDTSDPMERALAVGGVDERFHTLHVHPELLAGYDLPFDGPARLKIYPDLWEHELADAALRARLAGVLSQCDLELLRDAYWTHFYLRGGEKSQCLDLHLKRPNEFVAQRLANPEAESIHAVYRDVPMLDVVAAVPCRAQHTGPIRDFTLYYMPARL